MPNSTIEIIPSPSVPVYLINDVLSKLAYIDECVTSAEISAAGDQIRLRLSSQCDGPREQELQRRVQLLVTTMSQDGFEPELQIIEDHPRDLFAGPDPLPQLLARREVVQEGPGYFVLGPLLTSVVAYVEGRLIDIATSIGAAALKIPSADLAELSGSGAVFQEFPAFSLLCHASARKFNRDTAFF